MYTIVGHMAVVSSSVLIHTLLFGNEDSLNGEGQVTETGGFDSLDKKGGYVASFALSLPDWKYDPVMAVFPKVDEVPLKKEAVVKEHDKTRQ